MAWPVGHKNDQGSRSHSQLPEVLMKDRVGIPPQPNATLAAGAIWEFGPSFQEISPLRALSLRNL